MKDQIEYNGDLYAGDTLKKLGLTPGQTHCNPQHTKNICLGFKFVS